jgi:hypothetical protein
LKEEVLRADLELMGDDVKREVGSETEDDEDDNKDELELGEVNEDGEEEEEEGVVDVEEQEEEAEAEGKRPRCAMCNTTQYRGDKSEYPSDSPLGPYGGCGDVFYCSKSHLDEH